MSSDSEPVGLGFLGLGNIAHHHAERVVDLGGRVAAGADIDDEARARFTEAYGAHTYGSTAELVADDDVDAVVVTTPNKFHEEGAVAALEAGLDVLLEKPLAHTVESAERIAAAAQSADGFCMVGFNNRFHNGVRVLRDYQREGRLGETTHVEANFVRRRGIPGRGTWFTSEEIAGGGAVIDIGVHAIDLALHFLDFPEVVEVSSVVRSQFGDSEDYACLDMWGEDNGPQGFDVGDSASAFIRCADGRTVSLEVAWAANRESTETFVVRGGEAGARFDMSDGSLRLYETATQGVDHFADTDVTTNRNDTHAAEMNAFLTAVAAGEAPERNTVEEALSVQRVIDAIYRSAEENRAVSVREATTTESDGEVESEPVDSAEMV